MPHSTFTPSIPRLRSDIEGEVIGPEDRGYDQARTVVVGGFDRRPAVIIRAADATDVSRAVSLAAETGLELAVRSGGHSAAAHGVSHGGIVLDLGGLRALHIDVEQGTAWAQSGMTTGEYTRAVGEHGLATGFGDSASVGIGGLTLGGGVGMLVRKYGLTIDQLLAAEVVTADGHLLRVDAESHPDLFWAIRGGGGNFGVVTRFHFRLVEVADVVGGMMILPASPEVIASFLAMAESAPDELSTIINIMPAPPMPMIPAEHHGRLVMMALMVYAGDPAVGEQVIAPFKKLAPPLVDMVRPAKYPDVLLEEPQDVHPIIANRTWFSDEISDGGIETVLDRLAASTAMMSMTQIRVLGGAMARVPDHATAFAHRQRKIMTTITALYEDLEQADTQRAWVDGLAGSLNPDPEAAYVNFLDGQGQDRIREAYPGTTWDRLVAVKQKYDPTNLFRVNFNVPPGDVDSQATPAR